MVGAGMVTLAKLFGKWGTDKAFGYYPGVYGRAQLTWPK